MERISLNERGEKRYWYPVVKSTELVNEKAFAKLLSKVSNHKAKEIEMLLSQTSELIINLLLSGNTVQLGELGSFRVTAQAEASDSEEEVTPAKIKKVTVRFTESGYLKNIMKNAKFVHTITLLKKKR